MPSLKRRACAEYIATYAFTSLEPGDLSFDASEVILVTEKDGDWWKGTAGNRSGIFPANYVSPKPEVIHTRNASAENSRVDFNMNILSNCMPVLKFCAS